MVPGGFAAVRRDSGGQATEKLRARLSSTLFAKSCSIVKFSHLGICVNLQPSYTVCPQPLYTNENSLISFSIFLDGFSLTFN